MRTKAAAFMRIGINLHIKIYAGTYLAGRECMTGTASRASNKKVTQFSKNQTQPQPTATILRESSSPGSTNNHRNENQPFAARYLEESIQPTLSSTQLLSLCFPDIPNSHRSIPSACNPSTSPSSDAPNILLQLAACRRVKEDNPFGSSPRAGVLAHSDIPRCTLIHANCTYSDVDLDFSPRVDSCHPISTSIREI